jgi:transcriptional regulator with XRE-family HTH domain
MDLQSFSEFLKQKRDQRNLTNSKLALMARISAVYLGEIINNKKLPPDKKTQYALAEALQLSESERSIFYNLAACERQEIPVDNYDYLLESKSLLDYIRKLKAEKGQNKFDENN